MADIGPALLFDGLPPVVAVQDPIIVTRTLAPLDDVCPETVVTGAAPLNGLTQAAKIRCLETEVPNNVSKWIALFTDLPDAAGVGGTEVVGSGYARAEHAFWTTEAALNLVRRMNVGQIEFPQLTADIADKVIGWGIYDAASLGNLILFGKTRDVTNKVVRFTFSLGNTPAFQDRQLKAGIQ